MPSFPNTAVQRDTASGDAQYCDLRRAEVPPSVTLTPEGEEYTDYYIGLECYDTHFHAQVEQDFATELQFWENNQKPLW